MKYSCGSWLARWILAHAQVAETPNIAPVRIYLLLKTSNILEISIIVIVIPSGKIVLFTHGFCVKFVGFNLKVTHRCYASSAYLITNILLIIYRIVYNVPS
jgi:hypothetical protein